jgi:hypothetical protein
MSLADKLLMSGLQRHVRICDVVLNSDAYLSCEDRVYLIQLLLEEKSNMTDDQIGDKCKEHADANLGNNMIRAGILRYSGQ